MEEEERVSRTEMLLSISLVVSQRATCSRRSVGVIIAKDSRIISSGYNGPAPGEPHCSQEHCDASKPCTRADHAEKNAIEFAKNYGINIRGCDIFCTDSPCLICAQLIIDSGISQVVYFREFRDTSGIELLKNNGIKVKHHHEYS